MESIHNNLIFMFSNKSEINDIISLVKNGFDTEVFDKLIYSCKGIDKYICENIDNSDSLTKYISVIMDNVLISFIEYRYLPESINLNYIVINNKFRGKGLSSTILRKSLEFLDTE